MTKLTTDSPLVLDPVAQALLFTEARTANAFSGEPVTDAQLRFDRLPRLDYDDIVVDV